MNFEFATSQRIVFGPGRLAELGKTVSNWGHRGLLLTGKTSARASPAIRQLEECGLEVHTVSIPGEPSVAAIQNAVDQGRRMGCQMMIGCGGGSVIDAAKAVAALLTNPGEPLDYMEVVGAGRPLTEAPLPCAAIPTTAGTGAEATRNAVLASPEHGVKVSLRHPLMLPRLALIDPELTYSLPPDVTATTGLDALTQLIEAFLSHKATPLTDGFCREGIPRAARSLRRVYQDGKDLQARQDMAIAALLSGMALANAGLGAVHGFAGPMGGMFPIPHGGICAALLPHSIQTNWLALRHRQPESRAMVRMGELARMLTGSAQATAEEGIHWIRTLVRDLNIPSLSQYGVDQESFDPLIDKAMQSSSMKGNPIELTRDELRSILVHGSGTDR